MTTQTAELCAGMAIHELILEARQDDRRERRATVRHPFFRQVQLRLPGDIPCVAFCREISTAGIGLLHDVELAPCDLEVIVPLKRGHSVRVRTRVVWCEPCGEGWYISGGQFLGVASTAF